MKRTFLDGLLLIYNHEIRKWAGGILRVPSLAVRKEVAEYHVFRERQQTGARRHPSILIG